ncbi:MAG: DHH family phosphoesterase [Bacilli bacterium]|nr:DHH family phosphoesterase [Bacilli bacterium]
MFKKLKKERGKILLLFLLESFIVVGSLIAIISLYHIEFVEKYSLFILLLFLIVANFFNIFAITKLLSKTEKYLNRTDITISSIFGNEVSPVFEFGDLVILVYNENDEIIWVSQTTLLKKDDILGQKVYDLISDFDVLTTQEKVKSNYTEIGGKTFEIEINTGLKVVYLKDVSTKVMQDIKVEQERPFIGNIVIDNYQDIIISLGEADFVAYVTEIKEEVMAWAKKYNLFIRSYGNDSFLIVGEEKNYQAILKDNFSIIEELRIAAQKNDNPLTISIGIGKGNTTSILRTSELSYMALNMALSRGGDQVVVNTFGKQLQYYGAKNEVKQTRSHVRGRVLAKSLASLIRANKSVIIMGHKNMDFDALGASLGVWALCKSLRTKAYVVYEDDLVEFQTKRAFRQVFDTAQINEMTVTPLKALQMVTDQTLVVVVDTHRPDSTMQPKILDKCKEVCVIDHHRKGAHFINNPIFQYHEPQSSSASELVTELIFYQTTKVNVSEQVANFLLSGICLDTKFFKSGVSGKTFEMAMNLKNYQASVEAVNEYFKEEYEEMKLISGIVNSAKVLSPGIFMATSDEEDIITRTALSKAADEILSTKGVQAVFVVGRTNNSEVSISARSLTDFNVQIIMEKMGGGGHFSKAAAQKNSSSIAEVASELEETVKVFLRDGGRV